MIRQFGYILPLNKIQEIFPDMDLNQGHFSMSCPMHGGWATSMKEYCDALYLLDETMTEDDCYTIPNVLYCFDKRLVKVIVVETDLQKDTRDCIYVNKLIDRNSNYPYENNEIQRYILSRTKTEDTVGFATQIPRFKNKKKNNALKNILQGGNNDTARKVNSTII